MKEKSNVLNVPSASSPGLKICTEVLQAARLQEAQYKEKKWKIPGRGEVELGDIYGRVADYVQKFVSVGDVASQIDPLHFGLPWAAVRLVLVVSLRITIAHNH